MIEINLIPDDFKKQGYKWLGFLDQIDLPKGVLWGVGGSFFTVLVLAHVFIVVVLMLAESQHISRQAAWDKMLPDRNNMDSMNQQLKDVELKLSTINDIAVKKYIIWSEKLNVLSDQMPKGLWFKKLSWENNMFVVEGSAFSELHNETTTIGNFVSNLKKDEGFSKDFPSIELNSVIRNKRGLAEVVDFKVTAKVK